MKKITIAIDGFSSTGKSTIAKALAKKLQYIYVDSGAMYRAVSLYAMEKGYISEAMFYKEELIADLPKIQIGFEFNESLEVAEVYLNGKNVEQRVRTLEVSNFVSRVAEVSEVRQQLVQQQQEMGKNKGVVMDGRDIGTVVFKDAEIKLFLTASADTRAQRRFNELIKRGDNVSYEAIYKNVVDRDFIDTTREDSPLVKANDAIEIDNSEMTKEQQFEMIYAIVKEKLQAI